MQWGTFSKNMNVTTIRNVFMSGVLTGLCLYIQLKEHQNKSLTLASSTFFGNKLGLGNSIATHLHEVLNFIHDNYQITANRNQPCLINLKDMQCLPLLLSFFTTIPYLFITGSDQSLNLSRC